MFKDDLVVVARAAGSYHSTQICKETQNFLVELQAKLSRFFCNPSAQVVIGTLTTSKTKLRNERATAERLHASGTGGQLVGKSSITKR